jgi:hypothetical protein
MLWLWKKWDEIVNVDLNNIVTLFLMLFSQKNGENGQNIGWKSKFVEKERPYIKNLWT